MDFLRLLVACIQCNNGHAHRLTESCHNTGNFLGRYRMNDQRKTKKHLLEELERERERSGFFQGLVENSPDAIVMTDAQGRLTYSSPAVEALSGYTAEDLIGMRVSDFYQGGVEEAREFMQLLLEEGQLRNYLKTLKSKDGRLLEVLVSASLLRDDNGEVTGTLGVWKDITEQKRAEEALRRSEERSDALYRISNLLAGAHDTDEVLDLIVNEATRLVGAKAAFIRLLEGSVGVPAAATASAAGFLAETELTPASSLEDRETVAGQVMAANKPRVLEDATTSEMVTPHNRLLAEKYGFYGTASIPLVVNAQAIGLFAVFDGSVRLFTEDEVSLLSAFADQASLAIEKARLLNEAEREKERSDALYQVSNLLASAHDTDEVLNLIVNEATRLLNATAGYLRLLEGDVLVPSAATESAAPFLAKMDELSPANPVGKEGGAGGYVLATKKPLVSMDIEEGQFTPTGGFLVAKEMGLQEFVAVPLIPTGCHVLSDQVKRLMAAIGLAYKALGFHGGDHHHQLPNVQVRASTGASSPPLRCWSELRIKLSTITWASSTPSTSASQSLGSSISPSWPSTRPSV
ncbi:MAG: PAS domain S-box protein [Chloroflexi bacterium]|nr:PAS domain S-box protein [Chloroflexota bacterium]